MRYPEHLVAYLTALARIDGYAEQAFRAFAIVNAMHLHAEILGRNYYDPALVAALHVPIVEEAFEAMGLEAE